MKHQGQIGFTYDSPADEWAAWCLSVLEHKEPEHSLAYLKRWRMWADYDTEAYLTETRRFAKAERRWEIVNAGLILCLLVILALKIGGAL